MEKHKINKVSGITLIALVITIIVLIILAGVSIFMLTGDNGILNKSAQSKKLNDEAQIIENIKLAYNSAVIKYHREEDEANKDEIFANKMQDELEKTYGVGNATVTGNEDGTLTVIVNGKIYGIDIEENIAKQKASIVVGEATFKDSNGEEITSKIEGEGTVYIHFTASLTGGSISSVTATGLTPSLISGEWVTPVTANGTYEFTITGSTEDGGTTTTKSVTVNKFSIGLKVGDTVTYTPSGTYSWKAKYAASNKAVTKVVNDEIVEDDTNDIQMSSAENGNFRITTWKVLSYNEDTEEIQLVPNEPTSQTVSLLREQGYNNGVKLLNDACDELYSTTKNGTKIITARSINIEDFEGKFVNDVRTGGVLTDAAITARNSYINNSTDKIKYGNRYTTKYSSYRDSSGNYISGKNYPIMYELEADSIVNGASTSGTLGLSSQSSFIERLDANLAPVAEKVTNATSIRPKQTYYNLGKSFNNTYKAYFKTYENNGTKSYADLLSPRGVGTGYWVATRCVNLSNSSCTFEIRMVKSGCLDSYMMSNSGGGYGSAGYRDFSCSFSKLCAHKRNIINRIYGSKLIKRAVKLTALKIYLCVFYSLFVNSSKASKSFQRLSTSFWNSSIIHSLPSLNRCLNLF